MTTEEPELLGARREPGEITFEPLPFKLLGSSGNGHSQVLQCQNCCVSGADRVWCQSVHFIALNSRGGRVCCAARQHQAQQRAHHGGAAVKGEAVEVRLEALVDLDLGGGTCRCLPPTKVCRLSC